MYIISFLISESSHFTKYDHSEMMFYPVVAFHLKLHINLDSLCPVYKGCVLFTSRVLSSSMFGKSRLSWRSPCSDHFTWKTDSVRYTHSRMRSFMRRKLMKQFSPCIVSLEVKRSRKHRVEIQSYLADHVFSSTIHSETKTQ